MPPPFDYHHAALHRYTALSRRIIGDFRDILPLYRECVRGELCVHLIYFAHLHFRAGSSLFMGWFPAHPPAYYCALNIDTLSRGGAPRPPNAGDCATTAERGGVRRDRRTRGTAPRPPKTLRCSASERGQFVARTWFLRVENFEHALFYANCPLLACFGRML